MKISFVNPPIFPYKKMMRDFDCAGESKGNYLYQPYDLLLLSGFIPQDWDFQLIDAVAEKISPDETFLRLDKHNPEVIVCSVAGLNWSQDFKTVQEIRSRYPKVFFFIFGDLFVDEYPRQKVSPWVDGIFASPVLFDFANLQKYQSREFFNSQDFEAFHLKKNVVNKSLKAPRKISVPLPKHRDFVHKSYRWPFIKKFKYTTIFTSWGCPYSCSYCILNKFPNYWREYTEIIEEMVSVKKMGFDEIYIGDKSFGLPLANTISLLDEMINRKLNLSWSTYFHPNQYSKELLIKMKMAGCHTIVIGIETKNLNDLKRYNRHVRSEQLYALIAHANELGIEICADFILGLPHDTQQSIEALIQHSCDLNIQYASFNIATPLPGSSIRQMALQNEKIKLHDQHFDSSGKNIILSFTSLSPEDLLRLRNKAIKKFYMRPQYLLNRFMGIKNWEHLRIQMDEGFQVIKSSLGGKSL